MSEVEDFIRTVAAEPFAWGKTDCASIADRWVQQRRGFSPMERFGRKHANEAEARAWLAEGHFEVHFNRVMRASRLTKVGCPTDGAIGLVLFDGRMCIGILSGSLWFSRHEDGLVGAPWGNFWKAWAV